MAKTVTKGNGYGFERSIGGIAMQRCFECGRENYALAVYSGQCAWCNHDANKEQADG